MEACILRGACLFIPPTLRRSIVSDNNCVGHGHVPAPYPPKDHWEYNLYEYHKGLSDTSAYEYMATTPGITTADFWAEWCRAMFYAGTTLRLWNEVPEIKAAFLSACALEEGAKVFLIGKYVEESGLAQAVRSLVGDRGGVTVAEIGERVIEAFREGSPAAGTTLQWDLDHLDGLPDASLDRVVLFGAASHVAGWPRFAREVDRVLRDGGLVAIAETPLGGAEFREATHLDSHYESFVLRVLSGLGVSEYELPDCGPKDLAVVFEPHLAWSRHFSRQGVYLFYGQKGGAVAPAAPKAGAGAALEALTRFPAPTEEVRAFLAVQPARGVWDLMSEAEKRVWGATVEDINRPHVGNFVTWGGGALCWNYRNQRQITDLMWSNLAAGPGDKVMMIGEFPEDLGTLEELQHRVGPGGEIALVNITRSPKSYDYQGWQAKRKAYMDMGSPEEWPYDFADPYPDEYFDVLFLPQGVHHCNNWLRDAPRLLRAVKPGGQVIAIECGVNRPQMATARQISAQARIVGDRVFALALPEWLVGPLSPEGPLPAGEGYGHEGRPYHDVSAEHLREAFGDALTDVCSLEPKGWILFWGYKRDS
jgi:SAM-dependent methyltransferase